jgi:putative ABC transport system ATP-binding protein
VSCWPEAAVRDESNARVLELTDVTKSYRSGELSVDALRGVSFVVRKGEFVATIGPSGSGKTTLLGILGCLDRPTSGSYRLVGQEMSELPETKRAHVRGAQVGFIFQAYNLLPRSTAYKNVELPLVYARVALGDRRQRVLGALEEVGLSDRVSHLPTQLSGGQQQRTAIARALVARPSVVLADEPTGNLDSASAEEVLGVLERVNRNGATIVLVTHSGEVAERASRILRMADGLVVADDPVRPRPAIAAPL